MAKVLVLLGKSSFGVLETRIIWLSTGQVSKKSFLYHWNSFSLPIIKKKKSNSQKVVHLLFGELVEGEGGRERSVWVYAERMFRRIFDNFIRSLSIYTFLTIATFSFPTSHMSSSLLTLTHPPMAFSEFLITASLFLPSAIFFFFGIFEGWDSG